jgi:formylglycine-generating enzyme required for sulfatase activity
MKYLAKSCGGVLLVILGLAVSAAGQDARSGIGPKQAATTAPAMVSIPAGKFEMGDHHNFVDPKHGGDETPIHTVRLDAFLMAKTHVTNQQFGEFLSAALAKGLVEVRKGLVYGTKDGGLYCDTSESDAACSIGWDGKAFKVLSRANHPMVCVRWEGAAAYCNWLSEQAGLQPCYDLRTWRCDFTKNGFRLPTEAEWEYAARGGKVDPYLVYPYGDKADGAKANMPNSGDPYETGPLPHTTPVGFYNGKLHRKADFNWPGKEDAYQTSDGANGFGLYDMAGNAWQWCNDWYDSRYYTVSPAENPRGPERGQAMPDGKAYHCIRGGSWYNGPDGHSRVSNRNPAYYRGPRDPDHNWYAIGFRVARNGESAPAATAPATAGAPGKVEPTVGLMLNSPKAFRGYTLFAPKHFLLTYLIDNEGRVVNTWQSKYEPGQSAYLLPNGHLLRCCFTKARGFTGGGEGGRIEEYDWQGKMVWEFDYATDTYMQHHDIKPLPNGNILMLVVEKKTREQCLAAGFDERMLQDRELYPDSVIEIQPTYPKGGKVVWEWHVWDHLVQDTDRTKPDYGKPADHPELVWVNCNGRGTKAFWNHMNSLDYNPKLDQILLSVRGCSEIWIIDHGTTTKQAAGHTAGKYGKGGDLLYRWGNPAAYGRGAARDQMLFQQHDPTWIAEGSPGTGNILIFNNGLNRLPPGVASRRDLPPNPVGKDWGYSSVDEIVPPLNKDGTYDLRADAAYGPTIVKWTYSAKNPTDFFAEAISGAQRLPNGNTLICDGTSGVFFEVTPVGETVWKYVNPVVRTGPLAQAQTPGLDHRGHKWNAVFNVTRYAPDYAGLAGKDLTPKDVIPGSGPQMPERTPEAEPPRGGPGREGDRPPRPPRGEGGRGLATAPATNAGTASVPRPSGVQPNTLEPVRERRALP